jgi:dihydropteroate synthase-like protein
MAHGTGPVPRRVLFVTGTLAEPALRRTLEGMAPAFAWDIAVLRITVAALMTTPWIARLLEIPPDTDLVLIPGLCEGELEPLARLTTARVVKGPLDLREIPEYFGQAATDGDYGDWDIRILAEINNAPRLTREAIRREAEYYRSQGADVIDIGCTPGLAFPQLESVVRELVDSGMTVSIDTLDSDEIVRAVRAGAEFVLSITPENVDVLVQLTDSIATYVVLCRELDESDTFAHLLATVREANVPFLLDPVLEPIGFGFAASLGRFIEARKRWPDAELMMGVGNLTELTAADTTGVNALLIAFCQELGIRTVLTTEVIPWARGSVREIDIARRLMHHATTRRVLPKRVDDRLLTVKDPKVLAYSEAELRELGGAITDSNYRIFTDRAAIYVFNRDRFVRGTEIQEIFDQLEVTDPTHAFYLGKELAKAKLAITLGKSYRQEGSLRWGYLTPADDPRREHVKLTQRRARPTAE